MEGLLDDTGDVVGVFDQVAVLGERRYGTGDVYFLEMSRPSKLLGT